MSETFDGAAARRTARIAGVLYVGTIVSGMFGVLSRQSLIVRGDAVATAANILGAEPLYRLSFIAELTGMGCYVAVTALLYELLKPQSRSISRTAAFFSLVGCAVGAVAASLLLVPFMLLDGAAYLRAFTPEQLQALSRVALRAHGTAYAVGMVNFGVYCSLIGWLVWRSGSRLAGSLMALAGASWLFDTSTTFLAPAFSQALGNWTMIPGIVGEGALTIWLLAGGVGREPAQRAVAAAA